MSKFESLYLEYGKMTLTLDEVAQILQISKYCVKARIDKYELQIGKIPRGKKGYIYTLRSVVEYLEALEELAA